MVWKTLRVNQALIANGKFLWQIYNLLQKMGAGNYIQMTPGPM